MKEFTTTPTFGEDSWLFSGKHERPSMLEVVFSSPVRIRKVRIAGSIAAVDDRDADIVEFAERMGVQVIVGTQLRYRAPGVVRVGEEVRIWISKKADAGVTASFRWSEVGG